jgi:creatinine amidohydrolase/Fe(II)-dependent formamide hydrolase-like protein
LGTDTFIATTVTQAATARARGTFVVLPALAVGKSNEHRAFTGTLTLTSTTLARVVTECARCLAEDGFAKLVLVSGHGGNVPVLEALARDLRVDTGMLVFVTSAMGGVNLTEVGIARNDFHGGDSETSLILALRPELVKLHLLPASNPPGPLLSWLGKTKLGWAVADLSPHGYVGEPRAASADKGRRLLELASARLAAFLQAVAGADESSPS